MNTAPRLNDPLNPTNQASSPPSSCSPTSSADPRGYCTSGYRMTLEQARSHLWRAMVALDDARSKVTPATRELANIARESGNDTGVYRIARTLDGNLTACEIGIMLARAAVIQAEPVARMPLDWQPRRPF